MKKTLKKIFRHPIGIGVTTAVLSAIISTPIVAYVKSESFSEALVSIFNWLSNLIKSILTFGVPVWVLLLILIVYFKLIKPLSNFINRNSKPPFLDYTDDVIEGIRWEWEWIDYWGKYDISSRMSAVCINCNGYLVCKNVSYYTNTLECEHCGFKKDIGDRNHEEYFNKTKREILRRVRNKYKDESA
ncbi:hypothetical protein [Paenibacillus alvei]|uniref:hypothetical protein n=1 Tax=Paenibacillus alvei TaxID=44250 RepID=UPI0013DBC2CC|nr:hypothetical protein [Paenibacillus alvei]NEZ45450.1 hypothetical protein [Paenibacillus alvei]